MINYCGNAIERNAMLSVSESAEVLGVSAQRVRAMISDGVLPAIKVGRAWVLEEKDVFARAAAKPKGGRPRATECPQASSCSLDKRSSEELKRLYLECKEAFRFRPSAADIQAADCVEEAAFYMAVADFFLREKQADLVRKGVF